MFIEPELWMLRPPSGGQCVIGRLERCRSSHHIALLTEGLSHLHPCPINIALLAEGLSQLRPCTINIALLAEGLSRISPCTISITLLAEGGNMDYSLC